MFNFNSVCINKISFYLRWHWKKILLRTHFGYKVSNKFLNFVTLFPKKNFCPVLPRAIKSNKMSTYTTPDPTHPRRIEKDEILSVYLSNFFHKLSHHSENHPTHRGSFLSHQNPHHHHDQAAVSTTNHSNKKHHHQAKTCFFSLFIYCVYFMRAYIKKASQQRVSGCKLQLTW